MIRLMTYNIEYGMRWPATRDLMLAQHVDVICLQESGAGRL